jgi:luciferase-type oxidoreductase
MAASSPVIEEQAGEGSGERPSLRQHHDDPWRLPIADDIFPRVFADRKLTVGIVSPVRTADGTTVDLAEQVRLARIADELGFAAYWVRDVPLNGPWYPETIGHLDPFVALGAVAATTSRIAIGTAATVLPLRHPFHVAKAAASLQALSGSRLILGLGAGDRPEEFAALDAHLDDRSRLFREHWQAVAGALNEPMSIRVGEADYELRPSNFDAPPLLAVGSGGQTVDWISRAALGWLTYHREPEQQRDRHGMWRRAVDRWAPDAFRAFGVAMQVDLTAKEGRAEPINLGYRTGADGLRAVFEEQRALGVHHLLLNLRSDDLAPEETLALTAQAMHEVAPPNG